MRRFTFLILLASFNLSAQDSTDTKPSFEVDILGSVSQFYLNGDMALFEAPLGLGPIWNFTQKSNIGLYLAPSVIVTEDTVSATLRAVVHTKILESFSIGFGWEFWEHNQGSLPWEERYLFFTIGVELLTL